MTSVGYDLLARIYDLCMQINLWNPCNTINKTDKNYSCVTPLWWLIYPDYMMMTLVRASCILHDDVSCKSLLPVYYIMMNLVRASCRTIIWNPTTLCHISKSETCCVVQKPTQQHQVSWAELSDLGQGQAGQVSDLRFYCNWFVSDFTLLSVFI